MSIQTEINRLNTAKTNILKSISNKGVDTSSVNTLNDIPTLIDNISTSENLTSEFNDYETYLSTQETTIDDIITALQNKSEGTGADVIDSLLQRNLTGEFRNDRITTVGAYACYGCSKLTSVVLSNATSLGISAFNACSNMAKFEAPLVTSITTQSFYACNALTSLSFPVMKTIGAQGVRACKKLARVDLGTVTSIGALSFDGCSLLDTVIVRTTSVPTLVNVSAFSGTLIASGTGYIYVNDTLVENFKTASNWSTYSEQIKPLSELEE